MKYIKQQKGQIGLIHLFSIGATIVVAVIGGYFSQTSRTDAKLELTKSEQAANVLQISQRTSVVETKTDNLEKKVDRIETKIDELLRRVK